MQANATNEGQKPRCYASHASLFVADVSGPLNLAARRAHNKVLLVTFDSDNSTQSHAEALTKELQSGFKALNRDINGIEVTPGRLCSKSCLGGGG